VGDTLLGRKRSKEYKVCSIHETTELCRTDWRDHKLRMLDSCWACVELQAGMMPCSFETREMSGVNLMESKWIKLGLVIVVNNVDDDDNDVFL
jgi:hypothetical protein